NCRCTNHLGKFVYATPRTPPCFTIAGWTADRRSGRATDHDIQQNVQWPQRPGQGYADAPAKEPSPEPEGIHDGMAKQTTHPDKEDQRRGRRSAAEARLGGRIGNP